MIKTAIAVGLVFAGLLSYVIVTELTPDEFDVIRTELHDVHEGLEDFKLESRANHETLVGEVRQLRLEVSGQVASRYLPYPIVDRRE